MEEDGTRMIVKDVSNATTINVERVIHTNFNRPRGRRSPIDFVADRPKRLPIHNNSRSTTYVDDRRECISKNLFWPPMVDEHVKEHRLGGLLAEDDPIVNVPDGPKQGTER